MRLILLLTLGALGLCGCLSSDMHPPEWYNWYSIKPYSPAHKTPGYRPLDEKRPRSDRWAFFFFYSSIFYYLFSRVQAPPSLHQPFS
jgi:hypothetical protein